MDRQSAPLRISSAELCSQCCSEKLEVGRLGHGQATLGFVQAQPLLQCTALGSLSLGFFTRKVWYWLKLCLLSVCLRSGSWYLGM
jgi:hypothetical protein